MFSSRLFVQDPGPDNVGAILGGIVDTMEEVDGSDFVAAVAYATRKGTKLLVDRLEEIASWGDCAKRWLISIDFGRTEPAALTLLSELTNSEVRIPNGSLVVGRGGFSPKSAFHTKMYAFRNKDFEAEPQLGLFAGSANLSASGLVAGSEAGVGQTWLSPLTDEEAQLLEWVVAELEWFESAWTTADPLQDLIDDYVAGRLPEEEWRPVEEQTESAELVGEEGAVIELPHALSLANAKALWIETVISPNLGVGVPGNQLDLFRGARVFFGRSAIDVPPNTSLGDVLVRCRGYNLVTAGIRFGNNQMDKINLPLPGKDGPPAYDNLILLFERRVTDKGDEYFRIRWGNEDDLAKWRDEFQESADFELKSGRRWGLLL